MLYDISHVKYSNKICIQINVFKLYFEKTVVFEFVFKYVLKKVFKYVFWILLFFNCDKR